MTPKQRVLKRWPKAKLEVGGDSTGWSYDAIRVGKKTIGTGPTPRAAWADAERRMK